MGRPLKAQLVKLTLPKSASGKMVPLDDDGASAMTSAEKGAVTPFVWIVLKVWCVVSSTRVRVKLPVPPLVTVPVISSPGLTVMPVMGIAASGYISYQA